MEKTEILERAKKYIEEEKDARFRKEVEELLNLGKTSAFKYLSILCDKEILLQKALGRNSFFVLNPKIKL